VTGDEPPVANDGRRQSRRASRLLIVYLVVYHALLAGAVVTMWRSGLIAYVDRTWTVVAIVLAVALGGLLALLSHK
jgi:hypothetical protein